MCYHGNGLLQSKGRNPWVNMKVHSIGSSRIKIFILIPFQDEVQPRVESPPNFRPPPPPTHGSPKVQPKRPTSKRFQTSLLFTAPCRMHQESHALNHPDPHIHPSCSGHTSPCTVHHSSSPCVSHRSPSPCSLHRCSPCSLHRTRPSVAPPAKDLVQFLMSKQTAMLPLHPESASRSRGATPTPSGSARSSPSLSPLLRMPAPPPCSPEKPEVRISAPDMSPSMARHHRLNPEQETVEEKTWIQPRGERRITKLLIKLFS